MLFYLNVEVVLDPNIPGSVSNDDWEQHNDNCTF